MPKEAKDALGKVVTETSEWAQGFQRRTDTVVTMPLGMRVRSLQGAAAKRNVDGPVLAVQKDGLRTVVKRVCSGAMMER